MNINEMTIGEAKEIAQILGGDRQNKTPFTPGKTYLIRTVTFAWYGTVREADDRFVRLGNAAWIADTGRFGEALEDPDKFSEVETATNDVFVAVGSIVDATEIANKTLSTK